MARVAWLALLMTAPLLAGCVESEPGGDLVSIFGEGMVSGADGNFLVTGAVLEATFGTEWNASATLLVEVPKVTLTKQDPGPSGGGGVTQALEAGTVAYTLKVRPAARFDLGDYQISYGRADATGNGTNWSSPQSPSAAFEFPVNAPGRYAMAARLHQGDAVVATLATPAVGAVGVHWIVESSVHPLKPYSGAGVADTPEPTNYDQMADRFTFPVSGGPGKLVLETTYRGNYDSQRSTGTDIDLQADAPGGECTVAAAGDTPDSPTMGAADPGAAHEKLQVKSAKVGTWTVLVGAVNCQGADYFYQNPDAVPYTLDVLLTY